MATRTSRRHLPDSQDKTCQLSCEVCRERKVRCDKRHPCSTCSTTGATCKPVYRKRLARGRHVKSLGVENKDLQDRVAKLEELVANQNSNYESTTELLDLSVPSPSHTLALSPPATSSPSQSTTTTSLRKSKRAASPRYLANEFWVDLVDTVSALPSFLESTYIHGPSLSRL